MKRNDKVMVKLGLNDIHYSFQDTFLNLDFEKRVGNLYSVFPEVVVLFIL